MRTRPSAVSGTRRPARCRTSQGRASVPCAVLVLGPWPSAIRLRSMAARAQLCWVMASPRRSVPFQLDMHFYSLRIATGCALCASQLVFCSLRCSARCSELLHKDVMSSHTGNIAYWTAGQAVASLSHFIAALSRSQAGSAAHAVPRSVRNIEPCLSSMNSFLIRLDFQALCRYLSASPVQCFCGSGPVENPRISDQWGASAQQRGTYYGHDAPLCGLLLRVMLFALSSYVPILICQDWTTPHSKRKQRLAVSSLSIASSRAH